MSKTLLSNSFPRQGYLFEDEFINFVQTEEICFKRTKYRWYVDFGNISAYFHDVLPSLFAIFEKDELSPCSDSAPAGAATEVGSDLVKEMLGFPVSRELHS